MEEKRATLQEENDITLKSIILTLKEYFEYVLKHWKLVTVLIAVFITYKVISAYMAPKMYKAELTFMMTENDGSALGGLSGLLGGFLPVGAGDFQMGKIIEMAKSMKIIQKVLLEKKTVKGQEDFLANHIIDVYDYHDDWEESDNEAIHGFLFSHDSIEAFNLIENRVLKILHDRIIGSKKRKGLLDVSLSDDTGIFNISVETESEKLSLYIAEVLYEKLGSYYIERTTDKSRKTFELVQAKADSLKTTLSQKEYGLADFLDRNRGLWTKKDKLQELRLQREVQILTVMYSEAVKNLEVADFALKNGTPFIQVIDHPFFPLRPKKESYLFAVIFGILLGIFIGGGFLVCRKIITDSMRA